jgi:hypothetical protein
LTAAVALAGVAFFILLKNRPHQIAIQNIFTLTQADSTLDQCGRIDKVAAVKIARNHGPDLLKELSNIDTNNCVLVYSVFPIKRIVLGGGMLFIVPAYDESSNMLYIVALPKCKFSGVKLTAAERN